MGSAVQQYDLDELETDVISVMSKTESKCWLNMQLKEEGL